MLVFLTKVVKNGKVLLVFIIKVVRVKWLICHHKAFRRRSHKRDWLVIGTNEQNMSLLWPYLLVISFSLIHIL